ncbi:MAG TPA: EAL domain-containing protein [Gammaproteobacteria bacterium]|nr:EAL domain-containing protein [Gammaproteobacteria bacterium]
MSAETLGWLTLGAAIVVVLALGLLMARRRTRRRARAQAVDRQPEAAASGTESEKVAAQWNYRFLEQVLDRIQDSVVICDAHGRIVEANEAASRLFRRPAEELVGEDVHALAEPTVFEEDAKAGAERMIAEGNTRIRAPGGEATAVAYSSCALGADGAAQRWAIVFRNLSGEHRNQKRIRYLASYDMLTRVPNRMEFQHRLQQGIARARRSRTRAALLYLDMDSFKDVNDRLGHPVGDRALEIMAKRIVDNMESGTLVGRLGGDEFAVLVEGLPADGDARPAVAATIRMLLEKLSRKLHVEEREVVVTASIGAAIFPNDADNVIDLIRNADAAMYHAKSNGGDTYGFYAPEMNADAVDRLLLKNELRSAIQRKEFEVLYQPKVDLRDGRITGCEALLRWRHSRRGDVPPAVFIPLAEENNMISRIGEWVLDQVCVDFAGWQQHVPWPGRVAVNLSLKQLRQRDFVSHLERIFAHHQLAPSCIELEITESTLADHEAHTLRMLDRLYALGLHLCIDDFGTGYSSLSSLQNFPIGTLKIDQSFLRDTGENGNSGAIVGAILALGRGMKMDVVAEGIETPEQLELVRRLGCTLGQGHLFGEPVSGARYLELLLAQERGNGAIPHLGLQK